MATEWTCLSDITSAWRCHEYIMSEFHLATPVLWMAVSVGLASSGAEICQLVVGPPFTPRRHLSMEWTPVGRRCMHTAATADGKTHSPTLLERSGQPVSTSSSVHFSLLLGLCACYSPFLAPLCHFIWSTTVAVMTDSRGAVVLAPPKAARWFPLQTSSCSTCFCKASLRDSDFFHPRSKCTQANREL